MVSHLSDEAVAAFADGVLRDGARSRAEQHLSTCAECREAVRGQRAASAVLRSAPLPCLPTGLADRLRNLPGTTPLPASPFAPAALTCDSQPMFAAFHTVVADPATPARPAHLSTPAPDVASSTAAVLPPAAVLPCSPTTAAPASHQVHQARRRSAAGAGFGALALSAVAVSLLASTAATAGGATPTSPVPPPAVTSTSGGAIDLVSGIDGGLTTVGQFDLTGTR